MYWCGFQTLYQRPVFRVYISISSHAFRVKISNSAHALRVGARKWCSNGACTILRRPTPGAASFMSGFRNCERKYDIRWLHETIPPQTGLVGGPLNSSSKVLWSFRNPYSGGTRLLIAWNFLRSLSFPPNMRNQASTLLFSVVSISIEFLYTDL